MKVFAAALAALFAISFAAQASAQFPVEEVKAGVFAHSCCGIGSKKEDGVAINAEAVFKSPRIFTVLGKPRPILGVTWTPDSDSTNQLYTGLEWKVKLPARLFIAASGGFAIHDGETDTYDPIADADRVDTTVFYGCRVLFRISGDLGYRLTDRVSASLHWNHISNGGLCKNNEGMDQLGVRLGFAI